MYIVVLGIGCNSMVDHWLYQTNRWSMIHQLKMAAIWHQIFVYNDYQQLCTYCTYMYRALIRTQLLRISDSQLLIPAWESYQYPESPNKILTKGRSIRAVLSIEFAVPNTTDKQYRPFWNYKPSNPHQKLLSFNFSCRTKWQYNYHTIINFRTYSKTMMVVETQIKHKDVNNACYMWCPCHAM